MRALFLVALLAAQSPPPKPTPDVFAPVRFLEGRWRGTATGEPGRGTSERAWRYELRGRFLYGTNRSTYEPRPGRIEGEVHEDWSMLGYDRAAKTLTLRQFHVEGFVNEYRLTASRPDTLEFTTFHIDNLPEGWRARETWRLVSKDEYVETFSIAEPGKDFQVYSETRLRRETLVARQ